MKLSNLYLGLAVAASSLVGISTLVSPVSAASVSLSDVNNKNIAGPFSTYDFTGLWEFKYVGSIGGYRSQFGVKEGSSVTTLFSEGAIQSAPGNATPLNNTYTFKSGSSLAQFFLSSNSKPTIYSGVPVAGKTANFFIAKSGDKFFSGNTSDTSDAYTKSDDKNPFKFAYQNAIDGLDASGYTYAIGVNDAGSGDRDNQDFVVYARAVPVPAIVPGIALAAAFFGSKALKRNKKNASESVA